MFSRQIGRHNNGSPGLFGFKWKTSFCFVLEMATKPGFYYSWFSPQISPSYLSVIAEWWRCPTLVYTFCTFFYAWRRVGSLHGDKNAVRLAVVSVHSSSSLQSCTLFPQISSKHFRLLLRIFCLNLLPHFAYASWFSPKSGLLIRLSQIPIAWKHIGHNSAISSMVVVVVALVSRFRCGAPDSNPAYSHGCLW